MKHYQVTSPEILLYGATDIEPPEYGRCWGEYLAEDTNDAKRQALADPDFKKWVQESRSDSKNPMWGLSASLFRCNHGTCLGCYEVCPDCDKEWWEYEQELYPDEAKRSELYQEVPRVGNGVLDCHGVSFYAPVVS